MVAVSFLAGAAMAMQFHPPPGLHRWAEIQRIPRHRAVSTTGVPEPYRAMRNPLPVSPALLARGATVYAASCLSCHGHTGKGDGSTGRTLSPAPFDVAWLSEMKISRFDGFMYWTIAEGGQPLGTSMPAFKETLPADDIWAVTAYIQAGLPRHRPSPR
ncbi:hypothetical protein GCM10009087_36740 [Sphingomonas oligophenolica]